MSKPQIKSTRKAYKPRVKKQKSNAEIFVEKLKNGTVCRPEDSLRYGDPNCRSFELDEAFIEQRDHRAIMEHLENIDPIIGELRGQKVETLSNNKESEE